MRQYLRTGRLVGGGICYVDVRLLASTGLIDVGRLYTRDGRLAAAATEVELAFDSERRARQLSKRF